MRVQSKKTLTENEFRELYLDYYPIVYKVAVYILKDVSTAEDIVQEVFLKLWRNQELLSEVKNLKAYLISMTRHSCFDQLNELEKEKEKVLQLEHISLDNEDGEEEGFRKALEIAVSKLPPKCRLVFTLSRFEGLSNDEIAEYLEISKRTVETQISLALKAFRGDLKPVFKTYLSACLISYLPVLLQQI